MGSHIVKGQAPSAGPSLHHSTSLSFKGTGNEECGKGWGRGDTCFRRRWARGCRLPLRVSGPHQHTGQHHTEAAPPSRMLCMALGGHRMEQKEREESPHRGGLEPEGMSPKLIVLQLRNLSKHQDTEQRREDELGARRNLGSWRGAEGNGRRGEPRWRSTRTWGPLGP